MSTEKKTTKKPVASVKDTFKTQAAAEVKVEEVKAEVKAEEKKAEKKVAAAKTTAKKAAAGTKAAAKKAAAETKEVAAKTAEKVETAAKKATTEAKKAVKEVKTTAKKVADIKSEVVLQWNGNDYSTERLIQSAKDVWQYELGKNLKDFKSVQLYVKPDEGTVYGVVNGSEELKFSI